MSPAPWAYATAGGLTGPQTRGQCFLPGSHRDLPLLGSTKTNRTRAVIAAAMLSADVVHADGDGAAGLCHAKFRRSLGRERQG